MVFVLMKKKCMKQTKKKSNKEFICFGTQIIGDYPHDAIHIIMVPVYNTRNVKIRGL